MKLFKLMALSGLLFLTGCSLDPKKGGNSSGTNSREVSGSVQISGNSLSLVDVTEFSADVHGCASFANSTTTKAFTGSTVKLLKNDTGCFVVLNSFTVGDLTFTKPTGDIAASDWDFESTISFSTSGGRTVSVKVTASFPSPIGDTSGNISAFRFNDEVKTSAGSNISVKKEGSVTVAGNLAPTFDLSVTEAMLTIDNEGITLGEILFSCPSNSNFTFSDSCNGVSLSDLEISLYYAGTSTTDFTSISTSYTAINMSSDISNINSSNDDGSVSSTLENNTVYYYLILKNPGNTSNGIEDAYQWFLITLE